MLLGVLAEMKKDLAQVLILGNRLGCAKELRLQLIPRKLWWSLKLQIT